MTVTHPHIERYFMTIDEATELVIQAGALAKSGDIFLLDMGKPVKIVDVAKKMINLSGLQVKEKADHSGNGIAIRYTGLRPGEKLYEKLYSGAPPLETEHPKIMLIQEALPKLEEIKSMLSKIETALHARDTQAMLNLLEEAIPNFKVVENDA